MKLKFIRNTGVSGTSYNIGDVADFDESTARLLQNSRRAVIATKEDEAPEATPLTKAKKSAKADAVKTDDSKES